MKTSFKVSLVALLVLVVIFTGLAIFTIARSNEQQIKLETQANNQNVELEQSDHTTLIAKTLIVPENLKTGIFNEDRTLNLPKDFQISLWANDLNQPRQIDWTANGTMVVGDKNNSVTLYKANSLGYGEKVAVVDTGLNKPASVDFYKGNLYVGTENQILLYTNLKEDGTYDSKSVIIDNLPVGGHWSRTVKVGPDEKLYVTVGSSCNVCEESDERRAAMLRANLDGSNVEIFATGLRNTVDFVFKPEGSSFKVWGVDNGRDMLGDDLPPEEVNVIEEGKDYGWPYCYGSNINNPEYPQRSGYCKAEAEGVKFGLQAHSAPLGLTFLVNDDLTQRVKFPPHVLDNDLFIAFHGSWNRSIKTGYKIVRLDTSNSNSKEVNFVTGWLKEDQSVWGRPVDVKFNKEGDMFITDDEANAIYKVEYIGAE